MSPHEAVNVRCANIDTITGETLSHEEVYDRIIDYLGGLSAVAPYIPFSITAVRKALKTDIHLNNLAMQDWDAAAGFVIKGRFAGPTFSGIWNLYRAHGINTASASDGVCILKRAARRIANLPDNEVKEIYANARYAPAPIYR